MTTKLRPCFQRAFKISQLPLTDYLDSLAPHRPEQLSTRIQSPSLRSISWPLEGYFKKPLHNWSSYLTLLRHPFGTSIPRRSGTKTDRLLTERGMQTDCTVLSDF
ncbi:hypothetical protein AAHC03_025535 [Spirometra sp. Aus1]